MTVIDISYWQHFPDFGLVQASGRRRVISKCGGGEGGRLYQDSVYAINRVSARAAGLAVGSYFFNGPVNPTAAADFQMSINDWHPGDIVAIDVESNGNQPHWTVGQTLEWCHRILAHGVPANVVFVYMSSSVDTSDWAPVWALGVQPWIAQYGPNDGNAHTPPSVAWTLWQYTSAQTCPGIVGLVDTNQTAPSWASETSTPIGEDMPLDQSDKDFINLALAYVVRQIAGTDEYVNSPLTIKQVRNDIGYIAGPKGSPDNLAVIHAAVQSQAAVPVAVPEPEPAIDLDALAAKVALLIHVPESVPINYAALAKAVNDDTAKRMAE